MKAFETLDEMAQEYAREWNKNIATSEHDLVDAESVKGFAVERIHRSALLQLHGILVGTQMTNYIRHFGYVAS
jgi:hypothetical protein